MNELKNNTFRTAIICTTIVLVAVAYSFRFISFLHPKEAALWLGLCIAAVAAIFQRNGLSWEGYRAFFPLWLLLAVANVANINAVPVPADQLVETTRLMLLLVFAAVVFDALRDESSRIRIIDAILISIALVAALGLLQYAGVLSFMFPVFETYPQRVYSVFGNQDLFGGYLALGVPLALCRGRKTWWPWLVLILLVPGILISGSRSAWLAAGAGIAVATILRTVRGRHAVYVALILAGFTVTTIIAAPDATINRIKSAVSGNDTGIGMRFWFWHGTVRMIRDAPWCGVGFGQFPYHSPRYMAETLHAPTGTALMHDEVHVEHPHSVPLELFAETGLLGVLCACWFILRAIKNGYGAFIEQGGIWGALAAFAVFSLFNDAFRSAPHAVCALILSGIILARHPSTNANSYSRTAAGLTVLLAVGLGVLHIGTVLAPSYQTQQAEDAVREGEEFFSIYKRATDYPWPNARAHLGYGNALLEAGWYPEAYEQFSEAMNGLDTGEVYFGLAASASDSATARRWAEECIYRWPSSKPARELLMQLEITP